MKVFIESLGCDKNLCDAEHMIPLLLKEGFSVTEDEESADVAIINTCCFISDALSESIENIIALGALKKDGRLKALVVTGCMAERFENEIRKELPEVDCIVGTASYDEIVSAVKASLSGEKTAFKEELSRTVPISGGRIRSVPSSNFPLKISEGCSKGCTYCVIPSIRGPYRSYEIDDIVREAARLSRDGKFEISLVAQETTLYGTDIYGKKSLPDLLSRLSELDSISRIRIMYAYPEEVTKELILSIRDNEKVCHYLDLPIQHCSDRILKLMGRRTTKQSIKEKIALIREQVPDMALRTTLMCGFPGETEDDHQELLDFVSEMKFDHLGVFSYSREKGTKSCSFPDQVKKSVKEKWKKEVMSLQQGISEELSKKLVGKTYPAVVDGYLPKERCLVTRIYRDAPEIDSCLFVESERELMAGEVINVKITEAGAYDYRGEID